MIQAKFSLTPILTEFISNYKSYGFKDKSSLVQAALQRLKDELELQSLKRSAELYAEVYDNDSELLKSTDTAVEEWPE